MYNIPRSRGRGGGRGFSRGGPPMRGGGRGGSSRDYYGQGRPMHSGPRLGPGSGQGQDPDRLLSALGPEAKLALTQALVATVLNQEGHEGRSGSYRDDRDGSHRSYRDMRREGRGGYKDYYPREQQRRHYGDDRSRPYHQHPRYDEGRSYRDEERGQGRPRYDRDGKPPMGPIRERINYHKYVGPTKRRSSPHSHTGSSIKRQRQEEFDAKESPRREVEKVDDEHKEASAAEEGESKDKAEAGEGATDGRPSGVQVTICADGERNVNSEGHARSRVAGFLYVELRCPHCPGQHSITFKEYKYHLGSGDHKNQLSRLAHKHSLVLRKIRVQQRQEQKDIEAKWKEEKPEEFQNAVTRFCNTCKLAFKYLGYTNEGINRHNRSKLHRMQRHYLHPRCGTCRITFPTRMVYEHHMCSINHLRMRSSMLEKYRGSRKDGENRDDMEFDDIDLDNFMTLDSVGEDDDEVGSEHEEITGGLDAAEIADNLGGEEEADGTTRKLGDVSLAWEKLQLGDDDDEEEEDQQPLGTDYVRRVQAYFCELCHRIIRGDSSHGVSPVRKHCRGVTHISHYNELHPAEQSEAEESGGEEDHEAEDSKKEAEGEAVDATKEEGEGEEEAEGEEEEAEEEEEEGQEAETGDKKEAKKTEQVEDEEEPREEEEEMEDEEEVEGMAEDKEEGWDEEVGDDFTAP
ncbi:uncharacterized protein LOC143028356 isoform X2 [Oratosquilla oratoria]|uniref:uncharacterized protein LOC143028356 isoform X2 n=1 Tax=Oratosquilla oratoria TaxID=337810 RepID=UPI003F77738A